MRVAVQRKRPLSRILGSLAGVVFAGWGGGVPAGNCEYAPREALATVDLQPDSAQGLVENSGLAQSRLNERVFWGLNDSDGAGASTGRDDWAFALGADGRTLRRFRVTSNARDPEDLAIGPGPEEGVSYIYWGEIGDNYRRGNRGHPVRVWRFAEPEVDPDLGWQGDLDLTDDVTEIRLVFPSELDRQRTDLETLMVDPQGDLYVATKRTDLNGSGGRLYVAPFPQGTGEENPNLLQFVAEFPWPPARRGTLVGGDINPQGDRMILLNGAESRAYVYERRAAESWAEAIEAGGGCSFAIDLRPQLEAVAWETKRGRDLFTLSEGRRQPLHRYRYLGGSGGPETPEGP